MSKYITTNYPNVYSYESKSRLHNKKADLCFYYTIRRDGKKIWIKVGWKSEGFSAKYAADERARAIAGISNVPTKQDETCLTFDEAFIIYDEKHISVSLKQGKTERYIYSKYLKVLIGNKRLDCITVLDIENIKIRYSKVYAAATVKHILSFIKRVYRKIIHFGLYAGSNPMEQVKMPLVRNARTRFLSKDEAQKLMTELQERSEKWYQISMLSLYTGMRLSEILHLERQDICITSKTINIRDSKSGSRTIPMNFKAQNIVFKKLNEIEEEAGQRLFTQNNGLALQDGQTGKVFRDCVKRLALNPEGIDRRNKVCFHTLRHTYCSWLAMAGVPLYTIGELVGHASHDMTKRYSHLSSENAQKATSIMDNIII